MDRFKSIIIPMQGKSKSELHWLYNIKWHNDRDIEQEKIFTYNTLRFWFEGTGMLNSEKLLLYVEAPVNFEENIKTEDSVAIESYMLNLISPIINGLSKEYINDAKNAREKAQFEMQEAGNIMLRRSGIKYSRDKNLVLFTLHFNVPLVNTLHVNAKSAFRAIKDILEHIEYIMNSTDMNMLLEYIYCHRNQKIIRENMQKQGICAFVANGSILPRENGSAAPMRNALPFCSPKELEVSMSVSNGKIITGMGIKCGVTVITGGGYSGKSTLLNAIEEGIYDHIPGDGREYVLASRNALKTDAEDGRPVHSLDISPFFRYLPENRDTACFTTAHASGSVSQAANIIEAVCGGSDLLLIDEDKSATNFMMRDLNMRKIVKTEPIIPFTDRVRELYYIKGVSTILVIGGSSEYLSCADCVIIMDEYKARDITEYVSSVGLPEHPREIHEADWQCSRRLTPIETGKPFIMFQTVDNENEKKILLDDYSADVTHITSILNGNQMNTLALVMEQLLTDKEAGSDELINKAAACVNGIFGVSFTQKSLQSEAVLKWYDEIRPIDAACCAQRMRGLFFKN